MLMCEQCIRACVITVGNETISSAVAMVGHDLQFSHNIDFKMHSLNVSIDGLSQINDSAILKNMFCFSTKFEAAF